MADTIPGYFSGKHIFVTGGTGFMGKVLIEKILRSCPDINTLYVLVRNKKGKSAHERWNEIWKLPVFDRIKQTSPLVANKIKIIEGSISEGLGLSSEDKQLLVENVELLYHGAAAVQFTNDFVYSFRENTLGTYYVAEFAKSLPKLQQFIYVSTAFANCDKDPTTVEEKVYSTNLSWKDLITIVQQEPTKAALLSPKLLRKHPTPYTLTKALAEEVMQSYSEYYPVLIVRPSIVMAALTEPVKGWLDSINAVAAIYMAVGSGVLRVVQLNEGVYLDFVTVDYATKAFLIATWKFGKKNLPNGIEVVSCNFGESFKVDHRQLEDSGKKMAEEGLHLEEMFWYPLSIIFNSKSVFFYLASLLLNVLPAYLGDFVLKMQGKTPRLVPIAIKITSATYGPLDFFMSRNLLFPNKTFVELPNSLCEQDKKDFSYDVSDLSVEEVFKANCMGAGKYILHIDEKVGVERRKAKFQKLKYLHYSVTSLLCFVILFFLYNQI